MGPGCRRRPVPWSSLSPGRLDRPASRPSPSPGLPVVLTDRPPGCLRQPTPGCRRRPAPGCFRRSAFRPSCPVGPGCLRQPTPGCRRRPAPGCFRRSAFRPSCPVGPGVSVARPHGRLDRPAPWLSPPTDSRLSPSSGPGLSLPIGLPAVLACGPRPTWPAAPASRPTPPTGTPAVTTDLRPGGLHRPAPAVSTDRPRPIPPTGPGSPASGRRVQPPCADVSPWTRPSIRTGPLPAGSSTASLAMDSIVRDCFTSPLIRAFTSLLGIGTVAPVAAVRFS